MNERSFTINAMISLIIVSVEIHTTQVAIFTTGQLVHFGSLFTKNQLFLSAIMQFYDLEIDLITRRGTKKSFLKGAY